MRIKSTLLALCLALFIFRPSASQAELVTRSYTFLYSGFAAHVFGAPGLSPKAPVDHWTGSFTITYDPSAREAVGSVDSFSSNFDFGTFAFDYDSGDLIVGTNCSSYGCAVSGGLASAALAGNSAAYSVANGLLFFGSGSIRQVNQVSAVPEPSTWAMLLIGFAAVGAMMFKRRSPASLSAARCVASSEWQ